MATKISIIMADLSCKYLGLSLKNPIVAGSSGLTSTIENLKQLYEKGAGAVVLKSIFEEQIRFETERLIQSGASNVKPWNEAFAEIVDKTEFYYDEAYDYLTNYAKEHTLNQYLKLISDAKNAINIPVIASINCTTASDWQYFAKSIQSAGADAIELNVYVLPSDFDKSRADNEKVYLDIINEVKKFVTIPIALKIGYYFSSLAQAAMNLSETGIAGLTLFTRPYNPDINIDKLEVSSSNRLSSETEYLRALRWVALLSGKLKCNIAAATGIHCADAIIKQLLAGAAAVQMTSAFYKHSFDIIPTIIEDIKKWMKDHNFSSISEFKGLLSKTNINDPSAYERVQFIRLYSGSDSD